MDAYNQCFLLPLSYMVKLYSLNLVFRHVGQRTDIPSVNGISFLTLPIGPFPTLPGSSGVEGRGVSNTPVQLL